MRSEVFMREMRNIFKILVSKPEEKILLGGPQCSWEDTLKMSLLCTVSPLTHSEGKEPESYQNTDDVAVALTSTHDCYSDCYTSVNGRMQTEPHRSS
jgi:hypothetical protein